MTAKARLTEKLAGENGIWPGETGPLWYLAATRLRATVLAVMFFGGLNSLGFGLLGEYIWRTFENTKGRPGYVVAQHRCFAREGESK